jgi:hypothetical protein
VVGDRDAAKVGDRLRLLKLAILVQIVDRDEAALPTGSCIASVASRTQRCQRRRSSLAPVKSWLNANCSSTKRLGRTSPPLAMTCPRRYALSASGLAVAKIWPRPFHEIGLADIDPVHGRRVMSIESRGRWRESDGLSSTDYNPAPDLEKIKSQAVLERVRR